MVIQFQLPDKSIQSQNIPKVHSIPLHIKLKNHPNFKPNRKNKFKT